MGSKRKSARSRSDDGSSSQAEPRGSRDGGRRASGPRRTSHRRTWITTIGLGSLAVAGFFAVGHFWDSKPKPAASSGPAAGAAQKPRAVAATPSIRYGAEDREKLNRQIAAATDAPRRAAAPERVAMAPAAAAPAAFLPPADIPPPRRMSSAEWRALDSAYADQLRRCWPQADARGGYVPVIKVEFDSAGALARKPVLIGARNPQEIAAGEAFANAVARCGPMQVPAELRPFHAQWKVRTIRLDPPQMSGL
jgi:hypothetical protein